MRIVEIEFSNFKMFQRAVLPVGDLTLLIGPNGVGKTTALDALELIGNSARNLGDDRLRWFPLQPDLGKKPQITVFWEDTQKRRFSGVVWQEGGKGAIGGDLVGLKVFSIRADRVCEPSGLNSGWEFNRYGGGLVSVLSNLQDRGDGRFESLNRELSRWIPEFDRVALDVTSEGKRSFSLVTALERIKVPAAALSHGTLIAVALLTLAHSPNPPAIIGLEEVDNGLHPRLCRQVVDALRRFTHPAEFGDTRPPVQVIMTSHSPYIVDCFKDHLEDVVVIEKKGFCSTFTKLNEIEHLDEIVRDVPLGEAWYSGILGGVPEHT
jgi:predicted ATPase